MAITDSAAGAQTVTSIPWTITTNDVTHTLDGSSTSDAIAGTAHGGPSGETPDLIWFERHGGTSTDSIAFHVNVTNYDTTNDEVDYTVYLSGAGTNTSTIIIRMVCVFLQSNSGAVNYGYSAT